LRLRPHVMSQTNDARSQSWRTNIEGPASEHRR
jgi:hypothetical protein